MKKLTLKSVAEELGVSTATISNAFNRPNQLSKSKREEILKRCQQIGYTGPNKAASSLRKGKTGIIAIILVDSISYVVEDDVASTFIKGVAQTLESKEKQLLLVSGSSDNLHNVNDFVDGYLCYGSPTNKALIDALNRTSKPMVTVDFNVPNNPSVNIDNQEACYQIAVNTVKKEDRVAIIGLRLIDSPLTCRIYDTPMLPAELSITRRRLEGYEKALTANDIAFTYDNLWSIPENTEAFALRAAREVLSSFPRPTIVYCMSDLIAVYFMREAIYEGLKVPEDIRVVGFDGTPLGQRFHPNLTTVIQNSDAKGKTSAEMLLNGTQEHKLLPFTLYYGKSCPNNK